VLAHNADVDLPGAFKSRPIHGAVSGRQEQLFAVQGDILVELLRADADPNAENDGGQIALHCSVVDDCLLVYCTIPKYSWMLVQT